MLVAAFTFALGYTIGALRRALNAHHDEFIITVEEAQIILDLDPPRHLREDLELFLYGETL